MDRLKSNFSYDLLGKSHLALYPYITLLLFDTLTSTLFSYPLNGLYGPARARSTFLSSRLLQSHGSRRTDLRSICSRAMSSGPIGIIMKDELRIKKRSTFLLLTF